MSEKKSWITEGIIKDTISKFKSGDEFEEFTKSFLSCAIGVEFQPVGGKKDGGIDGFISLYNSKVRNNIIYQASIQKDTLSKIHNTVEKLKKNGFSFSKLVYCTNQIVKNKFNIINEVNECFKLDVEIYDLDWFVSHTFSNSSTYRIIENYIDRIYPNSNQPGTAYPLNVLENQEIFVFLRQQFDSKTDYNVRDILADTLILYTLKDTDPEKNIVLKEEEIFSCISNYIKFEPREFDEIINKRIQELSRKPRKIKYHRKLNGYFLPFDSREKIKEANILDTSLFSSFYSETLSILKGYLGQENCNIKDIKDLLFNIIHKLFYEQGLEFSNFLLNREISLFPEKSLFEIINQVVSDSSIILKNKEKAASALFLTIREIVYHGSENQRKYLCKLSNTYMLMFLLQWNPKIASFFEVISSELNIFVCTSIIIPALSEYYLDNENKRIWNLLKKASLLGINLKINKAILKELCNHFRHVITQYEIKYWENESFFLQEEQNIYLVEEILIRSYFYAKKNNKVTTFKKHIDNFIYYDLHNVEQDLRIFLEKEFGIDYCEEDISIPKNDYEILFNKLKESKSEQTAKADANVILSIYNIRERTGESKKNGHLFKTWWLSKDVKTYKAVKEVFGDKYNLSCYMRLDFLYNFVVFTPKSNEVQDMFKEVFPTLLGVNLGANLPEECVSTILEYLKEIDSQSQGRISSKIAKLVEDLMINYEHRNPTYIKKYFKNED